MKEPFKLELDFASAKIFYIWDMRDGKRMLASFYDLNFAQEYVNYLNAQEENNRTNW